MKNFSELFFLILIFLCTSNCGGSSSGTTNVGNSTTTEITISKLTDDEVTVEIPLEAFGDSDADAATTTLTIYKNNVELSGDFDLEDNYDVETQTANLTLTGMTTGDLLTFTFARSGSTTVSYSGTISSSAATEASFDVSVSDDSSFISGEFSSSLVGAFIPTTGSCFRSDLSDYEAFLIAQDGDVTNIDFLEDDLEESTVFSDASSTSFSAAIPQTDYTVDCDFTMGVNTITGSCTVSEVTDPDLTSLEGDTCDIGYALCVGVDQDDYYDTEDDSFIVSSSLNTALDDCYEDSM